MASVGTRAVEPGRIQVVSFDCYGTLVDWEEGILATLRPILERRGVHMDDDALLELYGRLEPEAQAGAFRPYREVLRAVMEGVGRELGFEPTAEERNALVDSIGDWRPFDDTVDALRALKARFRLAIVSNIDDDLLARTLRHLEVEFDHLVTAERCGSYKPSENNFRVAMEWFGTDPGEVLHVAQSLFHDIGPAGAIGIPTAWVRRRATGEGATATPPAEVEADVVVPDLRSLVAWIEERAGPGDA